MKTFIISTIFLLSSINLQAQDKGRTIEINTSGQVEVPADIVEFSISINIEDESPQMAFNQHKQQESKLVELLREHDFTEEDLKFEPISLTQIYRTDERLAGGDPLSRTHQNVQLTLEDFELFERMQIDLIESGFDQLHAQFAASKVSEAKDEALRRVVQNARHKAEVIAGETGDIVGAVEEVVFGSSERYVISGYGVESLTEFRQNITISASAKVVFALESGTE